jgi:hypothetical protein
MKRFAPYAVAIGGVIVITAGVWINRVCIDRPLDDSCRRPDVSRASWGRAILGLDRSDLLRARNPAFAVPTFQQPLQPSAYARFV